MSMAEKFMSACRGETEQNHPAPRHACSIFAGRNANGLLSPNVSDPLGTFYFDVAPFGSHVRGELPSIAEPDRLGTVFETLDHQERLAFERNHSRAFPKHILIDIDHLRIAKNVQGERIELPHVTAEEQ